MANAAIIATARTAAKIAKVICVCRRLLQLRSLFMGNTFSNLINATPSSRFRQARDWEPVVSPGIGRPEADHGTGDHDAAHIGGSAISGLMALATIPLLWHFRIDGAG